MSDYVICMDASGDIDRKAAQENGIEFVPMEYSLGEEMRTSRGCEDEAVLKLFYNGQRNGDLTRTSQISPYMYEEYFEKFVKEGRSVLCFCLSSGLSSTYESCVLAVGNLQEKYPDARVYPVDTLAATGGIGILVEKAAGNMKIDENGKLVTVDKKRGNKAAMMSLFTFFKENYDPEQGNVVYICDADTPELAEGLAEKVREEAPGVTVRRTMLSPIIGAHTGPGMLSMILLARE